MYRVGFPGWKLAARLDVPLLVRVYVHLDKESPSFWADSPDLDGLVVTGQDLDELRSEINRAAGELLRLALRGKKTRAQTEMRFRDTAHGYSGAHVCTTPHS